MLFRPGPGWIADRPVGEQPLGPHRAHWAAPAIQGCTTLAGPLIDAFGGLAVLRAPDERAAGALVAADPAVAAGILLGEVRPWPAPPDPVRGDEAGRNLAVVRRLFEAVERRDRLGVLAAYDPAVVINEAPSLPYGGEYRGFTGGFAHGAGYHRAWRPLQGEAERALDAEIIAQGDRVVVLWTQKGRDPVSGEAFAMPAVSAYRMRDGRILDSRMYHFDAAASCAFLDRAKATAAP